MAVHLHDALSASEGTHSPKVLGLVRALALGLPVPEFLVLDTEERQRFRTHGTLSAELRDAVRAFVARVEDSGELPLFSVRCAAHDGRASKRGQPSLLNVGIRLLERTPDTWGPGVRKLAEDAFTERTRVAGPAPALTPREGIAGELLAWIERIYVVADDLAEASVLLVQRMVFGCLDERSGNGICCDLTGPERPGRRFRGVFLPRQLGMTLDSGSWGTEDHDLSELLARNPVAYSHLREAFGQLERRYGPDRYLEFTVEQHRLFVLQHDTRKRDVVVNAEASRSRRARQPV